MMVRKESIGELEAARGLLVQDMLTILVKIIKY
jgi:hypothetical protein